MENEKIISTTNSQSLPTSKSQLPIILAIMFLLIFTFIGGIWIGKTYFFVNENSQSKIIPTQPVVSQTEQIPSQNNNFFKNGLNEIPLDKLQISNFPNFQDVQGVVHYKDKILISGGGSIMEFNPKTNSIERFSDPTVAKCDSNLVIVGNFLFAPCRILKGELSRYDSDIPLYGIYKINLKTFALDYVYTDKDGILNRQNYHVFSDGDFVWVETFEGVARINSQTNKVEYFQKELGIKGGTDGVKYSVSTIIPDKDYVWFNVIASAYSKGGVSLYNKINHTWKAFGPEELRDDKNFQRIDIEYIYPSGHAMKLISNGLQIGFREGDVLVEKQYDYQTEKWTKVGERIMSGLNYNNVATYLTQTYFSSGEYGNVDKNGFTQLFVKNDLTPKYIINGRLFRFLSNEISGKKYIITSVSLDMINSNLSFPKTIMQFGRNISIITPSENSEVTMYTVENSDVIIVLDANVQRGMGLSYGKEMRIWAIDTKTDKILTEFKSDKKYAWRTDVNFEANKEAGKIFLTKKTPEKEKIIEYDTLSNSFKILDEKIAAEN